MENLRYITSLGKTNQRKLLKTFGHKTINDAIKHYTDISKRKYSEQEKQNAYQQMMEDYNDVVKNLKQELKEQKKQEQKPKTEYLNTIKKYNAEILPQKPRRGKFVNDNEYRKQNISFERSLKELKPNIKEIDDDTLKKFRLEVAEPARVKSTIHISNKYKTLAKEINVENPDSAKGFRSISLILNSAIPSLRDAVSELKGIKASFLFSVRMMNDHSDEIKDIPIWIRARHILNVGSLTHEIKEITDYARHLIPEIVTSHTGWRFLFVKKLQINVAKYKPFKGGSYLPLPSSLNNKKCCINIKNDDDKCLLYCILYHINKDEIPNHPERMSHYKKYLNQFDFSKINFPVELKDIQKIESIIDYGINVFGFENSPFPLHITQRKDDKIINLLMIGSMLNNKKIQHYVYINKLDIFATPKRYDDNGVQREKNRFTCVNCLHGFVRKDLLDKHQNSGCDMFQPSRSVLPSPIKNYDQTETAPTIEFKNFTRKFKAPVVIYADFESLIEGTNYIHDGSKSSTTKLADLPPCGYCFNVVSDYPELNFGLQLYRGENAVDHFLEALLDCGNKIRDVLKDEKEMIITSEQERQFKTCQVCHICDKKISKGEKKVRDHDHITGLYRGCAHESCNVNFNYKNYLIPTYFHNLKGFDGHLIIQGLKNRNFSNIKIIAQNFEKYMTFSFGNFRFLDSFAFMSSSLDTLSSNLLKDGKHNFKHTLNDSSLTEEQKDLLLCKGVYPYEYMDCYEKFDETHLPPIESFYSRLSEETITTKDYEHAKKVWDAFHIKNLGEYHDLYLKTDVLLLTDVFESFRKIMIKNYQLDPANNYFTLPNYAWDAMLKKTGVVLDQLTDIDMYQMCELGIRGGISMITHRHAKANNKYMADYDSAEIDSYIMYLDANNLYGQAMVQKLPTGNFEWGEASIDYVKNFDADGNYGCIVECDLDYPESLHDEHNNYPLAPESKAIKKAELSQYQLNQLEIHNEGHSDTLKKLVPNLYNKKNYICHIKNLQYYISKGLVLKQVHRVLEFHQSEWLKSYIDFNTNERAKSKNDFEKDMYKLMNNAVFGKTMENMRERVDIQLVTDEDRFLKLIAKPQYEDHKFYSDENSESMLVAVKQSKKEVKLNKPIYVGVAVLDLSKLHMFKFHYDYIKPKYGNKATLLFTDTDSLCYHIQTEDIYKDMDDDKHLFDRSDYAMTGYRQQDNMNKKIIGKFKDETSGIPIVEFVGLRSKMYSILLDNKKEKKTGKGIKKCALKKYINHADYKRCLLGSSKQDQRQLISFNNLRSINHNIGLYRYTKVGLSCSNDKMYLLDDGITSLAYGHYKISENSINGGVA